MNPKHKLTAAQERILVTQYLMGDPVELISRVLRVYKSHVTIIAQRYGCCPRLAADYNFDLGRRYRGQPLQRWHPEARS